MIYPMVPFTVTLSDLNLDFKVGGLLYTVSQKKLDPFSFEHNFGNYYPITDFNNFSLLQTKINCDKVYHKIYHHTSSALPCEMNKNVLANLTGMIS